MAFPSGSPGSPERPRGRRLGGPPPRIAFVVDWLEDPYQSTVLAGAALEAEKRGASLVALSAGIVGGPGQSGAARNHLFELVRAPHFAGAILMTGTLGNHAGPNAVAELAARFGGIPVCSIAVPLDGHSRVLVDNAAGMRQAVSHLVADHHYRRIAFIRGPEMNAEAEARYGAYLGVLDAHGIEFDPRLVLPGDFQRQGGRDAICTLLDQRKVPPSEVDAVVGATDLMIMGALDEFERRGISVPADIAVLGFDDLEEVRYLSPPLSSVRQPLREQGSEAVKAVLAMLNGQGGSEERMLETVFIKRRSCGCLPSETVALSEHPAGNMRLSLEATLIQKRELILAELTRSARGALVGVPRGWELRLYGALVDELGDVPRGVEPFRTAFERILAQALEGGGDVSAGQAVISGLRRQLYECAGDDAGKIRRFEGLLHDARILTSAIIERSQARARLKTERWARLIGSVSARLVAAKDVQDLSDRIATELPRLGLDRCWVQRYRTDARDEVTLEIAWPMKEARPGGPLLGSIVSPSELGPEALLDPEEPQHLVVESMHADSCYGFAVFGYAAIDGYAFEMLRELLSATLAVRGVGN